MKRILNYKFLMGFVFFSFIFSIFYISVRIYLAPGIAPVSEATVRVKSDYSLMLLQCFLGIFAMILPNIIKKKISLNIPSNMLIIYALFLFCGIFLGEVRNYYFRVPHWDTILHIFSSIALGALGFSIVSLLNKSESITFSLSPGFVALFAFCFAISLGVIWEIYEFTVDYFLGLNTQKHTLESGVPLIGQEALLDTMKDLIVNAVGALTIAIIGYVSLKYKKGWLDRYKITRNKSY